MTEERGDRRRPADKTQHGEPGVCNQARRRTALFVLCDKMEGAAVIYGRPASGRRGQRRRFMSAITACEGFGLRGACGTVHAQAEGVMSTGCLGTRRPLHHHPSQ